MKANTTKQSARKNGTGTVKMKAVNTNPLTKKEKTALKVIYSHAGKRFVYESYSKTQPEMAKKYLIFVSKNPYVLYFKWDEGKQRFVA